MKNIMIRVSEVNYTPVKMFLEAFQLTP